MSSWNRPQRLGAGELDQRVTFERKVITRDTNLGSQKIAWEPIGAPATVWAKCTDVRDPARGGDEQAVQNQRIVQARTTVLVLWRSDVTLDMRIQWPAMGRTLQIVSKAQVRNGSGLELSCEEFKP